MLTTNVDHCFQKAGFDKKRLFYTQGDYGLFQCGEPCCPHCHKPLTMNLRSDSSFVEDEGWHKAAERYHLFLQRHENLNIVYLELGVGYNTPGIIKYPFWQMTAANPKATYACINYGEAYVPEEIAKRPICINADIGEILKQL